MKVVKKRKQVMRNRRATRSKEHKEIEFIEFEEIKEDEDEVEKDQNEIENTTAPKIIEKPVMKVAKKCKQVMQNRRVTRSKKQNEIEFIELEGIKDEDEVEIEPNIIEHNEIENTTISKSIELDDYIIQIGSNDEDDESKNHNDKKTTCIEIIDMTDTELTVDGSKFKVINGKRVSYLTVCPICDNLYHNLKRHMSVHTGEKKHTCPYCDKVFAQKSYLKSHIDIHTGHNKPNRKFCEQSFSEPNSLRSHMVHTKKKHHCDFCGKNFTYKNNLRGHIRTHTKERPYSCYICNKSFALKETLKKHFRTHTGEKPYKCEVCSKAFGASGNLSAHRLVHTKIRRFNCHLCPQKFSFKNVLKTHMKVHGVELNRAQEQREEVLEMKINSESE